MDGKNNLDPFLLDEKFPQMIKQQKKDANLFIVGPNFSGKTSLVSQLLLNLNREYSMSYIERRFKNKGKLVLNLRGAIKDPLTIYILYCREEGSQHSFIGFNKFETENYNFCLTYTRFSIKHAFSSFILSDFIILLVSAENPSESKGCFPVYQGVLLSKIFNKKLIICVTKMDDPNVNYNQEKFRIIEKEIRFLFKKLDLDKNFAPIIPVSLTENENLFSISKEMSWYKGDCLIDTIDKMKLKKSDSNRLRISLSHYKFVVGVGRCAIGKILSGIVYPQDKIYFNHEKFFVKSIESYYYERESANEGTISLLIPKFSFSKKGQLLTGEPFERIREFRARIDIYNWKHPIKEGFTCPFNFHSSEISCKLVEIHHEVKKDSNEIISRNPKYLEKWKSYIATFRGLQLLQIEEFSYHPQTGTFCFREGLKIIGSGIVLHTRTQNMLDKKENEKLPIKRIQFDVQFLFQ